MIYVCTLRRKKDYTLWPTGELRFLLCLRLKLCSRLYLYFLASVRKNLLTIKIQYVRNNLSSIFSIKITFISHQSTQNCHTFESETLGMSSVRQIKWEYCLISGFKCWEESRHNSSPTVAVVGHLLNSLLHISMSMIIHCFIHIKNISNFQIFSVFY